MADDDLVEVPEAVAEIYDAWHERHQRTGLIPARAECGRDANGAELWCDLADAGPDQLGRVQLYHVGRVHVLLGRYRDKPGPKLASEIARSMVLADVARDLRAWSLAGDD